MKSTASFLLLINMALAAVLTNDASACGPYPPIIPTPEFLGLEGSENRMADYEREENLKLWQSLTSETIPLADIEEAVYHDSRAKFLSHVRIQPDSTDNLFYKYLNDSQDFEIKGLLLIAKRLEKNRENMRSLWYYPRSRESRDDTGELSYIIELCRRYNGTRLRDRYALQMTRALFASRRYAECIEYSDSAFSDISDDNLMKRMAQRYAAGCWSRLGFGERGDSIFAKAGDVWSLSAANPAQYMIRLNPDAPQLIDYIRSRTADTVFLRDLYPEIRQLVEKNGVRCPGDWNFISAYIENEFNQDGATARRHIYKAMGQEFSSDEMKNLARAYKMKLDGQGGDRSSLLSDLKWMEGMADASNPEANKWNRRCRNIIIVDWIPRLWRKKDYSTAILLGAYADYLGESKSPDVGEGGEADITDIMGVPDNEWLINPSDYGNLSFQMMGSLTSAQLASVYSRILTDSPLYNFLRKHARTDKNYYYELIGTLALREGDYGRAEKYLSMVSGQYLKTMNIDKGGYLSRDPFYPYPSRWETVVFDDEEIEPWEYETSHSPLYGESNPDAKLKFAREMIKYRKQMLHGRTPDERGLAAMMYALGRRNSFEECWALTQYWRGDGAGIFEPVLDYWDWEDNFTNENYGFLYDYNTSVGHEQTEKKYEEDLNAALAMLTTDEAKAKAQYILNNPQAVIRRYGGTLTAQYIRASCDNWKSWL